MTTTPRADQTLAYFPPIPLVTGDTFKDATDTTHPIHNVTITLTAQDGTQHIVPLEYRYGGWWVPAELS